mmetsp:Transcript_5598/g.23235  ORF Transcript_5598/g.23235 Transcript_5598/m.23235 type:complete len:430 (-) Transcript_5598:384-1673(-)
MARFCVAARAPATRTWRARARYSRSAGELTGWSHTNERYARTTVASVPFWRGATADVDPAPLARPPAAAVSTVTTSFSRTCSSRASRETLRDDSALSVLATSAGRTRWRSPRDVCTTRWSVSSKRATTPTPPSGSCTRSWILKPKTVSIGAATSDDSWTCASRTVSSPPDSARTTATWSPLSSPRSSTVPVCPAWRPSAILTCAPMATYLMSLFASIGILAMPLASLASSGRHVQTPVRSSTASTSNTMPCSSPTRTSTLSPRANDEAARLAASRASSAGTPALTSADDDDSAPFRAPPPSVVVDASSSSRVAFRGRAPTRLGAPRARASISARSDSRALRWYAATSSSSVEPSASAASSTASSSSAASPPLSPRAARRAVALLSPVCEGSGGSFARFAEVLSRRICGTLMMAGGTTTTKDDGPTPSTA